MKGIVYKITNKINNKIYIGETVTTLDKRIYNHFYSAKTRLDKNKWWNALRKYNREDFFWEILESVFDEDYLILKEKLVTREIYYINKYDSIKNGYNSVLGNQFGMPMNGKLNPAWIDINIDWDEYIKLASLGFNRSELAEHFNIPLNHIKIWKKRLRDTDPEKGKILEELEKKRKKKSARKKSADNKLPKAIVNKVLKLTKDGVSIQKIHEQLDLPFKSVRKIREHAKLNWSNI